jgi:D-lyxose ketol-isomerase
MKRSEINTIMKEADAFIRSHGFHLPPFAYWSPADWAAKGLEVSEIVTHKLGWDITDFGQGRYNEFGLFLFTIRNGTPENLNTGKGKSYAEKLLIVDVNQTTPMHYHWHKMEDIINRDGGQLMIQLYNAAENGDDLAETDIRVSLDGVVHHYKAGAVLSLSPGESITLPPYLYHKFWAEGGRVLVGEVSTVNDDNTDNKFRQPVGRFPDIEEDEPPLHLLVNDYGNYWGGAA